jgi:hypothetical protein
LMEQAEATRGELAALVTKATRRLSQPEPHDRRLVPERGDSGCEVVDLWWR